MVRHIKLELTFSYIPVEKENKKLCYFFQKVFILKWKENKKEHNKDIKRTP